MFVIDIVAVAEWLTLTRIVQGRMSKEYTGICVQVHEGMSTEYTGTCVQVHECMSTEYTGTCVQVYEMSTWVHVYRVHE